jgi:hypothetical protein
MAPADGQGGGGMGSNPAGEARAQRFRSGSERALIAMFLIAAQSAGFNESDRIFIDGGAVLRGGLIATSSFVGR